MEEKLVTIPIYGHVTVSLDVKEGTEVTDKELIQLAMENVKLELKSSLEEDPECQTTIDGVDLVESEVSSLEVYEQTGSGNICYLERPWQAVVENY